MKPTTPDWQMRVGEIGELVEGVADLEQSITAILTTPRGSLAHDPDFGCGLSRYLDAPISIARPLVMADVLAAVQRSEPRVQVTRVGVEADAGTGAMVVTVEARALASGAAVEVRAQP